MWGIRWAAGWTTPTDLFSSLSTGSILAPPSISHILSIQVGQGDYINTLYHQIVLIQSADSTTFLLHTPCKHTSDQRIRSTHSLNALSQPTLSTLSLTALTLLNTPSQPTTFQPTFSTHNRWGCVHGAVSHRRHRRTRKGQITFNNPYLFLTYA